MIPVYVVVVVEDHGKINFFEPPCCRRGRGVTPHSETIVGDEPPCI